MLGPDTLGILFALTSAVIWGTGDFTGGLAARRTPPAHVLMLASLSGLPILIPAALLQREPLPTPSSAAWAGPAGPAGGVGEWWVGRRASGAPRCLWSWPPSWRACPRAVNLLDSSWG